VAATVLGASPQSAQLDRELAKVRADFAFPASSRRNGRRDFGGLARHWKEDTRWSSATTEIAMHPAYQAIIGMGSDALPMILHDLRSNSGHWYWALKAISNEDPVPPSDRGVIKKMKAAWLRWGEQKGLLQR
jgi:hypothetical protein